MKEKTCCFTGHRNIPSTEHENVKQQLYTVVRGLIEQGVIYYGCGGALGFDMIAAEVVLDLRKIYPCIKLIMVYPCKEQTKWWSEKEKEKYEYLKSQSNKVVYISEAYINGCMLKRNRHLVDNSRYCVCYIKKNSGGTAYTEAYAKKQNLNIIYIK